MKKFILLYKGPATPPDASHAGWPEWFEGIGDALVDIGSPMVAGTSITKEGDGEAISLNGYSIVQAEDESAAQVLVQNHPYLALGDEYSIEMFEIPKK